MSEIALPSAPRAHIHGEPLLEMPADLYIPPDALELVLSSFQGPLDLLLYLIRKHNLDVLDIPMAQLTQQYLNYIQLMQRNRLELAAEYLLMAAVLIEIKSRLLLPRPSKIDDSEGDDPRAELMRRLQEYEQMKSAAQTLNQLPQAERDFTWVQVTFERTVQERLPSVTVEELRDAWLVLLTRAKVNAHHTIQREELSVREEMSRLLRQLQHGKFESFENLFDPLSGLAQLVVTFLALLELAKERLLEITQAENMGSIYLRLSAENS